MHAGWETACHQVREPDLAEVLTHAFVAGCLQGKAVMGISVFPSTFSRQSQSCSSFSQGHFRCLCSQAGALLPLCTALCPAWLWQQQQQLWELQLVQATEDRLVEVAAKFPVAAVLHSSWGAAESCPVTVALQR